MSDPKR